MVSGWLVSERTDEQVLLLCNSSLNVRPRGPAFPHCVLPLPTNIREVPSRTSRSRHEDPGTGHQAAAWVGKDGVCSGAAEQAWLRAAQGPLHPEPEHYYFADSLHLGAAADTDRRQAEAVSGKPAANHAENNTVIRGTRIKSSVDLGGGRSGICTGHLGK